MCLIAFHASVRLPASAKIVSRYSKKSFGILYNWTFSPNEWTLMWMTRLCFFWRTTFSTSVTSTAFVLCGSVCVMSLKMNTCTAFHMCCTETVSCQSTLIVLEQTLFSEALLTIFIYEWFIDMIVNRSFIFSSHLRDQVITTTAITALLKSNNVNRELIDDI